MLQKQAWKCSSMPGLKFLWGHVKIEDKRVVTAISWVRTNQTNTYLMNKGTVKHFYLPLLYFPVFITKLQNPERNLIPLSPSDAHCSMFTGLTHIHCLPPQDQRSQQMENTLISELKPFGERVTAPGFKTLEFKPWAHLSRLQLPTDHICDWSQLLEWSKLCLLLPIVRGISSKGSARSHLAPPWNGDSDPAPSHCQGSPQGLPGEDISCLSHGITASPAALSSFQHLSDASAPPLCSALGPRGNVFPFLNRFGEECAKEKLHHSDAEGESADYIYPHRICKSEHNSTCAFSFNWKPCNKNPA